MKWFILLVGVVVLCGVAALLLGYLGGGMGRATSTLSHEPLPDGELTDADLEALQFDVGLRGYRMSEVDAVIGRLRRELKEKDEQISVLRGEVPALAAPAAETTPPLDPTEPPSSDGQPDRAPGDRAPGDRAPAERTPSDRAPAERHEATSAE